MSNTASRIQNWWHTLRRFTSAHASIVYSHVDRTFRHFIAHVDVADLKDLTLLIATLYTVASAILVFFTYLFINIRILGFLTIYDYLVLPFHYISIILISTFMAVGFALILGVYVGRTITIGSLLFVTLIQLIVFRQSLITSVPFVFALIWISICRRSGLLDLAVMSLMRAYMILSPILVVWTITTAYSSIVPGNSPSYRPTLVYTSTKEEFNLLSSVYLGVIAVGPNGSIIFVPWNGVREVRLPPKE